MKPLKIYMCDLTHETIVLVTDTIPINVGSMGAYAKRLYGDEIEIFFYKYPQSAIDAIAADPPDVLALSNYCWNSMLSEEVSRFAKRLRPTTLTIQGGTNFPNESSLQLNFLKTRPSTDIHVHLEGEIAFSNAIGRVLESRVSCSSVFDSPIDGCVFIHPSTREDDEPQLLGGTLPDRIRDLSSVPSPYLTGMMDEFFDGRLTPFLETNRGCPFTCSFCHTGDDYFQKTNTFSLDRTRDEIEYIAPRAAALGITNLHMADTNFGMYPRDKEIAVMLHDSREKYGWPMHIMATTGKNNKERVINVANILKEALPISMAMQSMDSNVLKTIRRSNIKLDAYEAINRHLNSMGRTSVAEMILGLPGETRETFLRGINQVIEASVSRITIYTLMLLDGTEFKDPQYRSDNGIIGKYRIVPRNFTDVAGTLVFDYEEAGIQTNHMSFDDYLYCRGYSLIVEVLHNDRVFEEFFRLALSLGVSRSEMINRAYDSIENATENVQETLREFLAETRSELWDNEDDLIEHYREPANYDRLLRGEVGGNLIYKYKAMSLTSNLDDWIFYLASICSKIAAERITTEDELSTAQSEIDALTTFCRSKLDGLLLATDDTSAITMESEFHILKWLGSPEGVHLNELSMNELITFEFSYSDDQIAQRTDAKNRYGSNLSALSVVVTRIGSLQSLIRTISIQGDDSTSPDGDGEERFTRYSLSN